MADIFRPLPQHVDEFSGWSWDRIAPYYTRLGSFPLTAQNVKAWLADWSQLSALMDERYQRLTLASTQHTADPDIERAFDQFVEEVYPKYQEAEQALKEKLLASGLEPEGMEMPLRNLRAEAALYHPENLPLHTQEQKLEKEYDKVLGGETILWYGEERTPAQMLPVYQDPNRARRERAWRMVLNKRLENRAALNDIWRQMLELRLTMARNAGYTLPDGTGDYRAYRWQQCLRFDYTPEDARRFNDAILEVAVPAAARIYEKYRQRLNVDSLRPWDLQGPMGFFVSADPPETEPLRPFQTDAELLDKTGAIFYDVDPQFGAYFERMRAEQLLDVPNRKHKAPGAYCMSFETVKRPFIFMNAVGTQEDVQTLMHEAGHAFHAFDAFPLPYIQQHNIPLEFCEVASMGMEFLGAPYFDRAGGFYKRREAARARVEKLETTLLFWGYMAVVDEFQHWVYENPREAMDPENCDETWAGLWDRYMIGVDWSELEQERITGWHRKPHIFASPFYYMEYGMAQLGAVQVWANSLQDKAEAVRRYRRALALGGTAPLPVLYETAGAKFLFDTPTLREAVELVETTIAELEE